MRVLGLPPESVTWRNGGFSQLEELAAAQVEMTDLWGRILARTLGQKPSKLPKPPVIQRPGQVRARTQVETDPATIAAFFRNHVSKGGE